MEAASTPSLPLLSKPLVHLAIPRVAEHACVGMRISVLTPRQTGGRMLKNGSQFKVGGKLILDGALQALTHLSRRASLQAAIPAVKLGVADAASGDGIAHPLATACDLQRWRIAETKENFEIKARASFRRESRTTAVIESVNFGWDYRILRPVCYPRSGQITSRWSPRCPPSVQRPTTL